MRDVNFSAWKPSPHHTYFLHVQNGSNAESVGLSLVQIGDGSEPCIGAASHPSSGYGGHVLVAGGKIRAGVEVQYFRDRQFIAETITDALGRHSIRLSPGLYQYRFLLPGEETREFQINVKAGHRVKWEELGADGEILDSRERAVKFITEELVCQWDNSDGAGFKWIDVMETVVQIARRLEKDGATLRQVSFAQFCRPDIVSNLRNRGAWAVETGWKDAQFAAAFRNLIAIAQAKLITLLRHDEATVHMTRNVQFDEPSGGGLPTRIIAPEGTENYLALARAAAVYHASTLGGQIAGGLAVFDPQSDGGLGTSSRASVGIDGALSLLGGENAGVTALPSGWRGTVREQLWNPRE